MRLSPKSVFFGIVAFGLPVAATIGWILGAPATQAPAAGRAIGGAGAGGIGAAPAERVSTSKPVAATGTASQPASPSSAPVLILPSSLPGSSAPVVPAPVASSSSAPPLLPPLTLPPPVPTPTEILPPGDPAPTSTTSAPTEASTVDAAGLAGTP